MRLEGKVAVVVGAGQSPGEGIGNGRATVLRFAREGTKVLAVDPDRAAVEETVRMVAAGGGLCVPFQAYATDEATLAATIASAHARWGRLDILHNNVGVSIAGGDAALLEVAEAAFEHLCHQPARDGDGLQSRATHHAQSAFERHHQQLVDRR